MCADIETDQVFAGSAQEAISKTFHLDCFVVGIHDVEIDRPAATREVTDGRSNRDVANPKLGMHAPDEIVVSAHHAGGNPKAIVQRNLQLVTETNPPGNRFEDPPNCFNGCRLHGGAAGGIQGADVRPV